MIYVVEDDKAIRNLVLYALKEKNYQVRGFEDGLNVVESLKNENVDLLILDIMLPEKDGIEILKEVREFSDIPVIMLTAKNDEYDKVLGLESGADDYITKPFRPKELLARVNAQLRRSQVFNKENLEIIEIENIRIYTKEYKVEKDGRELDLSRNEFELLIFLSKNPRQVFSREQLYDRIWGFDSYGDLNTVTVTINRLRQKIEDNPKNPKYILTVWGVGYKFEI